MKSRRNFLRTSTGLLALPWLESFRGGTLVSAAETAPAPPLRFTTLFFPNGVYPDSWQASQTEAGLAFGRTLEPLQPFAKHATIIDGLDNPLGGHLGQTSGFLSGIDLDPNEQGVVSSGTSLDQMLARHRGGETFLPSLNLGLEPPSQGGFGNRPRSYGNSISWSSPTSKIEPQINPQQAFDQVFFGQTEAGRRAAGRRKRIVDAIWGEARLLQQRVSELDRPKLEQYLDSIRDLEAKLEKTLQPGERPWTPPTTPALARPDSSGLPASFAEHMDLMLDILVLALQTDSTRVGTLVMGHSISRVVYDFADPAITRNHHDYSHHRNDPDKVVNYERITRWIAGRAAYFLERLAGVDEGQGTLLDNSVVLFGSGMKDGNVHDGNDVPIALFGNAGGRLKTERLITCPDGSLLAQLHLSLLHLYGVEASDFNGVTDRIVPGFA